MSYVLKFGDVWLVDGTVETHVCDGSQEIAVAYDPETATILKTGAANAIRAWRKKHLAKLDAKGVRHIFADPIVAAMPVNEDTVALLNCIRDNCLLVQAMIERGELPGLTAGEAARLQVQG
ncbi:MAG TPA: hypothetical protein P5256_01600 [Beijerinckiaceae bacterium]|mgnify:CR=1 FL=1|nr:hypothetical protein [Rhodoblastus sp.]MCC2106172.1 hypothetical protein [Hyphomicrobiales bacterium]HPG02447.1 hypothetical protein [Rhodoblastus sp.]HRY01790.1 hypothetical protein [Beijerinckiaceae bacterium]